jgi:membrane associated rhomboid family serine protease
VENRQQEQRMAESSRELVEMILRDCGAAGSQPWYPADYTRNTGVDRNRVDACLDELRLGGLVQLTEWVQGKGQGYTLTTTGRRILDQPRLLNQVRHGVPPQQSRPVDTESPMAREPADWDRGKALAGVLQTTRPALVTRMLIVVNVVNFVIGLVMVQQAGAPIDEYLVSWNARDRRIHDIRHDTGAFEGRASLLQGEWWRLLSCCFVHMGAVHLVLNMWVLGSIGPPLERALGHFRYIWLYLVSGIGGTVAAVYFHPLVGLAGASGAICGILGGLLAWVWLNRQYLRHSAEMLRNIVMNVVLIALISFVPGVSGEGHLGGGLVGLALAVPLNFNRFGNAAERWLGLAGAVALTAIIGGAAFYEAMPHSELEHVRATYLPTLLEGDSLGVTANKEYVEPFWKQLQKDKRVPVAEMKSTFAKIDEAVQALAKIEDKLAHARSYSDERINAALQTGREYIKKWQVCLTTSKELVDDNGQLVTTAIDKWTNLRHRVNELQKELKDSILLSGQAN